MADGSRNQANIVAVMGASESGKSAWIKQQLRKGNPPRLLIWDPQDEWEAFGRVVRDMRELIAAVRAGTEANAFKLIYQPGNAFGTYGKKFDVLIVPEFWNNEAGSACPPVFPEGDP